MELEGLHVEKNPLQDWLKIIIYYGITLILIFSVQRLLELLAYNILSQSVGDPQITEEILINFSQGMVGLIGIVVTWIFLQMDNLDFDYVGLKLRKLKDEGFQFLVAAAIVLPALSITVSLEFYFGLVRFEGLAPSIFPLIAMLVAFLGIGIGEEIIYRGYIYQKAKDLLNKPSAIILSSVTFGFIHVVTWAPSRSLPTMLAIAISAFFIGIVFAFALEMSKTRLVFPIYMHGWWNLFLFVYRADFVYENVTDVVFEVFSVIVGCIIMMMGLLLAHKSFPNHFQSPNIALH